MNDAIQINVRDNVAMALKDLDLGQTVNLAGGQADLRLTLCEVIQAGHKLAVANIKKGGPVIKYGEIIGTATQDIPAGGHVHVHNVDGWRGRGDLQ